MFPRKQLFSNPMPSWLTAIDSFSDFNKADVIQNSVYYPGARFDSSVIHAYSGFAHRFIFVDFDVSREDVLKTIPKLEGYKTILLKEISKEQISDRNVSPIIPERNDFYSRLNEYESIQDRMQYDLNRMKFRGYKHFCIWAVYQRKESTNPGHGPERLSLLYIGGEGVATYQAIYNSNGLFPLAIIICGADIGFGGNWTLFEQKGAIFERIVMSNAAGIPKYLFTDGRYDPNMPPNEIRFVGLPYWEKYTKKIPQRGQYLSIWTEQESI